MKPPTATAAIFAAGTITGALLIAPAPADAGHRGVPHRAILMFQGRCPNGYTGVYELNQGRFPRGSFEGRQHGGTTTHTHTVPTSGLTLSGAEYGSGGRYYSEDDYGDDLWGSTHSHSVEQWTVETRDATHLPPYTEVTFCTPS